LRLATFGAGATILGAAVAGSTAAAPRARLWLYDRRLGPYGRHPAPNPPTDGVGPLADDDLGALLAATEVIVGFPLQLAHYEALFRWRAEHQAGYRARYQRFRASLDRAAVEDPGCYFSECDRPTRARLLEKLALTVPLAQVDKSQLLLGARDWEQYHTYITREILRLFAKTDALIAIGYDAWPGVPRGLDAYRRAPVP
jgi:hypothetical protein